ncbi:hypothetical protein BJ508DRAFT_356732 [Ascobolus immersus RN42]|uniref:Uncharacterized protein n=1 Tax=Ascobolus immersus RN42 TaxID=1160509 RepID=A0A3N4IT74_ASCIM|nr:hypothetical protein BJ508DRAFT_356732 [Ascobolus immersus RN42]
MKASLLLPFLFLLVESFPVPDPISTSIQLLSFHHLQNSSTARTVQLYGPLTPTIETRSLLGSFKKLLSKAPSSKAPSSKAPSKADPKVPTQRPVPQPPRPLTPPSPPSNPKSLAAAPVPSPSPSPTKKQESPNPPTATENQCIRKRGKDRKGKGKSKQDDACGPGEGSSKAPKNDATSKKCKSQGASGGCESTPECKVCSPEEQKLGGRKKKGTKAGGSKRKGDGESDVEFECICPPKMPVKADSNVPGCPPNIAKIVHSRLFTEPNSASPYKVMVCWQSTTWENEFRPIKLRGSKPEEKWYNFQPKPQPRTSEREDLEFKMVEAWLLGRTGGNPTGVNRMKSLNYNYIVLRGPAHATTHAESSDYLAFPNIAPGSKALRNRAHITAYFGQNPYASSKDYENELNPAVAEGKLVDPDNKSSKKRAGKLRCSAHIDIGGQESGNIYETFLTTKSKIIGISDRIDSPPGYKDISESELELEAEKANCKKLMD